MRPDSCSIWALGMGTYRSSESPRLGWKPVTSFVSSKTGKVSKNRGRQTRNSRSKRSKGIRTLEGESGTLFGDIESRLGFFIRRPPGGSGRGDADCGRCRSFTPLQLLITRSYQSSTPFSSPHFLGMRHLRSSRDPSSMVL
ncbi:hypothetical protein ASPVEDRAFT_332723 [Aspergillus versicolor CBS 583.65]|uniref:Uncharacterized protein n=1 Tax=Aspergillus versicolor CBS 583.65 TaxID=1036611 RepID=A0A1L9PYV6_ASPVE|nr:uncharacterized protein ASPVEDRAFT_332723 [Aspergillus versicolor CBS 583.65]OJJ06688.1 hypothetical protein ASPVEDRAFT_332723 [Aspergillus versicolor CBS 583.65]